MPSPGACPVALAEIGPSVFWQVDLVQNNQDLGGVGGGGKRALPPHPPSQKVRRKEKQRPRKEVLPHRLWQSWQEPRATGPAASVCPPG